MRYRIERECWIIGQHSVPPTTEIDMAKPGQWNEIVRGKVPPLDTAIALDQEAYECMYSNYVLGAPTGVSPNQRWTGSKAARTIRTKNKIEWGSKRRSVMATKGSGGGGFGSRPHVKKPVKTGASARRDVPAGVNQIGAAQGNHVTEQGSTRYSGVKRDAGVLPGVGSVPLGNEVALNVGSGGPGKGRDPVMRAGSQGTYGAVNPGSPMTPSSGDLTKLDWKR